MALTYIDDQPTNTRNTRKVSSFQKNTIPEFDDILKSKKSRKHHVPLWLLKLTAWFLILCDINAALSLGLLWFMLNLNPSEDKLMATPLARSLGVYVPASEDVDADVDRILPLNDGYNISIGQNRIEKMHKVNFNTGVDFVILDLTHGGFRPSVEISGFEVSQTANQAYCDIECQDQFKQFLSDLYKVDVSVIVGDEYNQYLKLNTARAAIFMPIFEQRDDNFFYASHNMARKADDSTPSQASSRLR